MIWLNVAVEPKFSWPNIPIALPFEGKTIVLSPSTDTLACRAALLQPPSGNEFNEGATILSRFLSRLAWFHDAGLREIFFSGSSNPSEPGRLGSGTISRFSWASIDPQQCIYLPHAAGAEADLGLALYREGMSVNSAPFAFLSFFKILNIRHAGGEGQKNWINNNLCHISYPPAADRIKEILVKNSNVGEYMFVQGRCAVAHAHSNPLVNPDVYADKRRLEQDLPLIKELAAVFIEREFGILTASTFLHNHDPNAYFSDALIRGEIIDGRVTYLPYSN
jgi:hypothetical protein